MKFILGIVPDNVLENVVGIEEMTIKYTQRADTCSDPDETQFLKVTVKEAVMGEDAAYYDISTEGCDHWSVDSPDDLKNILQDFISRMKHNTTKVEELKKIQSV